MNIVGEALEIAQREMAERFDFVDEYFPSEPAWLSRFCAVWKAQVARPFRFTAIAESLSAQNLAALKDAGCEAIRLHIDTGNEKFRARIATRNLGNARLASVCAEAARLGIRVDIHAMTGLPLENPDLATETVEFIRALKSDSVSISFYAPIPGTPLFEFARDKQREVDPADFNPRRPRMRLASMDDADALRAYDALARLRRQRMIERAGPIDAYADWVGQADSAIVEAPFRPALEIAEAAIGGDKRLCLMQAIGARIGFPVEIRNGAALAFGLAMGPSPFGVRFAGTLKIEVRIRQGGADDLAFYKILDPASAAASAGWMDLTIPLAGRTEGPAEIWLECEPLESPAPPAPAYLAWARPRLFIPQAVRSAPARAEAARSDPRLEDSTHGDTLLLEDEIRELKADNKRLRDEVENLKFDLERRTDLIAKLNAEFEKMTRDISALEEQKSAWLRIRAEVEAKLGRKARKAFEEAEGAL